MFYAKSYSHESSQLQPNLRFLPCLHPHPRHHHHLLLRLQPPFCRIFHILCCANLAKSPLYNRNFVCASICFLIFNRDPMPKDLGSRPRNFSSTGCSASNRLSVDSASEGACNNDTPFAGWLPAWPSRLLSMPKDLGSRPRNFSSTGCNASNRLCVDSASEGACNNDTPFAGWLPAWPSKLLSMPKD